MNFQQQPVFILRKRHLVFALIIFFAEVIIALFVHDSIVRPWGGDFLVAILLYCVLRSFLRISTGVAAITVLIFSYLVETMQFLQIVKILGFENNALASVVMGTHFSWSDMVAYTSGIAFVLIIEKMAVRFQNV